ncbi:hypothetical protein BT96DRAFT_917103 [Gymnopus androsaceus JB14]|uniref:Uncharacterized protein n=1 Tax=Gymnopus androsaceus JB14 TaxID=1447944 RepID=A0A6A4I2D3_9AGAR|nr:hypothetical protein BT96DRAFT_917103 [Gymnopus androsaceus JB14]
MLIPPYYLEKSPTLNPQGEHGENRLGIRAQCVPQGTLPRTTCPCADWKTWPIKKMPTSIKLCSTPASAH